MNMWKANCIPQNVYIVIHILVKMNANCLKPQAISYVNHMTFAPMNYVAKLAVRMEFRMEMKRASIAEAIAT